MSVTKVNWDESLLVANQLALIGIVIKLNEYEYPIAKFQVHVSSGTYIRSLVEDLGCKLSVGGYTKKLQRQSINSLHLDSASPVGSAEEENLLTTIKHS